MSVESFARRVQSLRDQIARLERQVEDAQAPDQPLLADAMALLHTALAELGATQEALAAQFDQHAALSVDNARLYREAQEQSEWFRVTLSSIGDAVIATDAAGRVTFLNGVAETLTSWPHDEARGQDLNKVFQIVNETTRQAVESPTVRVLREGLVVGLANHTLLIARDGTERPIDDSGAPIRDKNGALIGVVLVFRDITERKRAEDAQRFLDETSRLLAESLDYELTLARLARLAVPRIADWCAVDMIAEDGTIQRLAVEHVDPQKVAWAHELQQRYPPDPQAPRGIMNVLRSGQAEIYPAITDEFLVASAHDAEQLQILRTLGFTSAMIVPLLASGRALGAITLVAAESGRYYGEDDLALAEELAHRAALAVENARLYREAQAAIRVRDQFLSIASHELKTPLTVLYGNTQLLQRRAAREGSFSERDRRVLNVINAQAERLNKMIAALLDISRIQIGQLNIEQLPLDLSALVRRVVAEVQPTLDDHTLECVTPDEPLMVAGDELRLEQVLQNLIGNAIKYSPAGGPIGVRIERQGQHICMMVTDEGIGIPESALPNLFSRFYRASNVDPQQIAGMGIGLYVVKEIVALHGGEVMVSSTEGAGSTFTITLPLAA